MAEYTVETASQRLGELTNRCLMGEKITIRTDSGNAVLINEEDRDSLVEAMVLLTIPNITKPARMEAAKIGI